MKKFLVIILALIYFTSTFGAMVQLDCCPEKLVHGLGWRTTTKNDCKDDHKQAKLGHEQKRTDSKIRIAKYVPASLNTAYPDHSFHAQSTLIETYPVNNAPPQRAFIPLYIFHCVYRR
jgi:hypothetical protein